MLNFKTLYLIEAFFEKPLSDLQRRGFENASRVIKHPYPSTKPAEMERIHQAVSKFGSFEDFSIDPFFKVKLEKHGLHLKEWYLKKSQLVQKLEHRHGLQPSEFIRIQKKLKIDLANLINHFLFNYGQYPFRLTGIEMANRSSNIIYQVR